jgi:hypothetical protein
MSTLLSLANRGVIERLRIELEPHDQIMRRLYARKEAIDDLRNNIRGEPSDWHRELTPAEQVYDIFVQFVAGHRMDWPDDFHVLRRHEDGIWELRPTDVRIFGWFPERDAFLVTNVDMKNRVVSKGLYPHYCREAISFRDGLDLDAPKFLTGVEPRDVISD